MNELDFKEIQDRYEACEQEYIDALGSFTVTYKFPVYLTDEEKHKVISIFNFDYMTRLEEAIRKVRK